MGNVALAEAFLFMLVDAMGNIIDNKIVSLLKNFSLWNIKNM